MGRRLAKTGLSVMLMLVSGCSIPFQQAPEKDPEYFKFLTPEARDEIRENSRCIYFIKDDGRRIEPYCK